MLELAPDEVDAFMRKKDFKGINVTIPYKEKVIPYLDEISDRARRIGAVNTIVNRDGRLYGHNTDYFGIRELLRLNGTDPAGRKVLILGSGGTSKTARWSRSSRRTTGPWPTPERRSQPSLRSATPPTARPATALSPMT